MAESVVKKDRVRVSVVVLNFNGASWLQKCLESLGEQSVAHEMEVIVADNASTDGSGAVAGTWVAGWVSRGGRGRFVDHGANLGYCEGNNRAISEATGEFLLILNNDAWLEPECLERLVAGVEQVGAVAGMPWVMNYGDDSFQSAGVLGMDVLGMPSSRLPVEGIQEILMPEGCAYLIQRKVFEELGGFDRDFFMYADEFDLSLRVWLAGYRAVVVPSARVHHRGAAQVNPEGGASVVEFRTSDLKRYFSNRNGLLALLKNGEDALWMMAFFQAAFLMAESFVGWWVTGRREFAKVAYWKALADVWTSRHRWLAQREQFRPLRKISDAELITRFFRWRLNRWDEWLKVREMGWPKVTALKGGQQGA